MIECRKFGYSILDAHAHIGYSFDGYRMSPEEQLHSMDILGIEKMLASNLHALYFDPVQGNREMADVAARYPERILGYVAVNPHHMEGREAYLNEMLALPNMVGIKLHPDFNSYPTNGPQYHRIYEYANRHGLLVLNHYFGDVKTIVELAKSYPHMKMICGHRCAYPNLDEIRYLRDNLADRRDIYFDTTSSCVAYGAIERYCEYLGSERILFGTDTPYFDPAYQVGRFLWCGLNDRDRRNILRENMWNLITK